MTARIERIIESLRQHTRMPALRQTPFVERLERRLAEVQALRDRDVENKPETDWDAVWETAANVLTSWGIPLADELVQAMEEGDLETIRMYRRPAGPEAEP